MGWGTLRAVLTTVAIFIAGMMAIGGTDGVLRMRAVFKKTVPDAQSQVAHLPRQWKKHLKGVLKQAEFPL